MEGGALQRGGQTAGRRRGHQHAPRVGWSCCHHWTHFQWTESAANDTCVCVFVHAIWYVETFVAVKIIPEQANTYYNLVLK